MVCVKAAKKSKLASKLNGKYETWTQLATNLVMDLSHEQFTLCHQTRNQQQHQDSVIVTCAYVK